MFSPHWKILVRNSTKSILRPEEGQSSSSPSPPLFLTPVFPRIQSRVFLTCSWSASAWTRAWAWPGWSAPGAPCPRTASPSWSAPCRTSGWSSLRAQCIFETRLYPQYNFQGISSEYLSTSAVRGQTNRSCGLHWDLGQAVILLHGRCFRGRSPVPVPAAVETVFGDVHLLLSIKKVSNQSKVQTPRHIWAQDEISDWRPAGESELPEAAWLVRTGESGERQQRQPPLQVEHAVQQQVQLQHPLSGDQQDAGDDEEDVQTGAGGADGDHQGGEAQPGPPDGGGRDRDPYGRVQEHGPRAELWQWLREKLREEKQFGEQVETAYAQIVIFRNLDSTQKRQLWLSHEDTSETKCDFDLNILYKNQLELSW